MRQPDEDTCRRARQRCRGNTGVLHCLPGCFEQQPVLRIDRGRLAVTDAEKLRIEARHVVEEPAPFRHRAAWHAPLGVIEALGVPTLRGVLGVRALAASHGFPHHSGEAIAPGSPPANAATPTGTAT